ncbi:Hypothetical predicted protein [Pelobates cultripes]|uniref:Uncharacterized protein n=1 Tax=Pelobates cultripes TaxID=61616 RepID=A0AAD1VUF1_PELCU|nr:Hypothetical predicted protein [Pelobates cultripes]
MAVRQNRPRRASGQDTALGLSDTRSHRRISKAGTLTPATHATNAPDLIPGYRQSTKCLSPTNTAVRATVKRHTTKRQPEVDPQNENTGPRDHYQGTHNNSPRVLPTLGIV